MNALPQFLTPTPVAGAPAIAAQAASAANGVTGFSMTCQQENFWCWAAVTQAVELWRGRQVTQSQIASDHIAPGGGLVCATPLPAAGNGQSCGQCDGPAGCGDPHFLSAVLKGRGRLAANGATQQPPTFGGIVAAIDAQRPLPVRINWPDDGGHFICVTGYRRSGGALYVTVHDPLYPGLDAGAAIPLEMPFDAFSVNYSDMSGSGGVPNYNYEVV
jgi:hypothetical protein